MKVKRKVTVLGAGIAGLTAAHELVERGFDVTVIDKHSQVGGMARTQWCTMGFPWLTRGGETPELEPADSIAGPTPSLQSVLNEATITFSAGWEMDLANKDIHRVVSGLVRYYKAWLARPPNISARTRYVEHRVAIEGFALRSEATGPQPSFEDLLKRLVAVGAKPVGATSLAEEIRPRWDRAGSAAARWTLGRTLLVENALWKRLPRRTPTWPEGWARDLDFRFEALPLAGFGPIEEEPLLPSVTLRLLGNRIPGEHGYRYFPGFYKHVFDSMKRIPLFEERRLTPSESARADDLSPFQDSRPVAEIESARTVMDNLVPTPRFAIAPGNKGKLLRITRTAPRSFQEVRRLLRTTFEDLKVLPEDLARFEVQILRYLTSCGERRGTYENQTWWNFLGADRMSSEMQTLVERWPQALIGLRAREADARTIGTITVQLLLEQVSSSSYRDGTLNGPTSQAWLEPWRKYLERRKVRFWPQEFGSPEVGSLRLGKQGVEYRLKGATEFQNVSGKAARKKTKTGVDGKMKDRKAMDRDHGPTEFLVLALSVTETQRVVRTLWDSLTQEQRADFPAPLSALLIWPEHPLAPSGLPVDIGAPAGPLRHYSGIQFYLENDLGPPEGHIYLADSDYRLSAISQAQFWRERLPREAESSRQVCVLSVDIGDWHSVSRVTGRSAAQSTRPELAKEVWRQIEDGLSDGAWLPPVPFAYHIDDDMLYGERSREEQAKRKDGKEGTKRTVKRELPVANDSPYLVNLAGDWAKRPGEGHPHMGYEVMYHNLVLAGSYMRTHTRLATMEAANESGRHAVNAILRHLRKTYPEERFPGDCPTWNPENEEVDDLDLAKRIDHDLFTAGLPHALDILGVEELVDFEAPRGAPGDPTDGRATLAEELLSRALEPLGSTQRGALGGDLRRLIALFTGQR